MLHKLSRQRLGIRSPLCFVIAVLDMDVFPSVYPSSRSLAEARGTSRLTVCHDKSYLRDFRWLLRPEQKSLAPRAWHLGRVKGTGIFFFMCFSSAHL